MTAITGPISVVHSQIPSQAHTKSSNKENPALIPAYIEEILSQYSIGNEKYDKGMILIKPLIKLGQNEVTEKASDVAKILSSGRLVSLAFENNGFKALSIHPQWAAKIKENNIDAFAVKLGENLRSVHKDGTSSQLHLHTMNESSYKGMVVHFFPNLNKSNK